MGAEQPPERHAGRLGREAVGDDPADWFPALTGHAWPGGRSAGEELGADEAALPFRLAAE
jgi:type IV secretion system protein VirB4